MTGRSILSHDSTSKSRSYPYCAQWSPYDATPTCSSYCENNYSLDLSAEGELSQESTDLHGTIFSHYLLTALRGAAERDHNQQVSLNEAYTYAYRQTEQRSAASTGNIMHPNVEMNVEGLGALVMTQIADHLGNSVLPKE